MTEPIFIKDRSNRRQKPVACYNLKGDKVKVYPNATEAARDIEAQTGIPLRLARGGIYASISRHGNYCGHIWKYTDEPVFSQPTK